MSASGPADDDAFRRVADNMNDCVPMRAEGLMLVIDQAHNFVTKIRPIPVNSVGGDINTFE